MNKVEGFLEKWLIPTGNWVSHNRTLTILKNAMISLIPITIGGSFALIIMYFPFIDSVVGAETLSLVRQILSPIVDITLGLISLYLIVCIAWFYAKEYETSVLFTLFVVVGSFLILIPFTVVSENGATSVSIPTQYLGSAGMFVGILSAFFSCTLYRWLTSKNLAIKLPDMVPPNVANSFLFLLPLIITFLVMAFVRFGFSLTPYGNMNKFIYEVLQSPMVNIGTGLIPTVIAALFVQLFWFMGLHGQSLVGAIMSPLWQVASTANASAFAAGEPLPYIVTQQFMEVFIWPQFFSLVIALVLFAKKATAGAEIGKISVPAGIFNISEPVAFGLPVVLNVFILIPWVLVMVVFVISTYSFMSFGIVPRPTGVQIPWTTPPLISGFLATNSIMGAVLQAFNLFIGVLIWLPFIRIINKQNTVK